ncbi:MAG: serine/threonine protein kinase [Anaerolineae bacterium]|nr:serine/threonine protein kinase [Anaerolineae bacterium]
MAFASLEGHTLGKYQVLEPLGGGGMARVYRAYHPQLDRYVAVKILRPDLVEDEEFLVRFQREARAVAALRHPNIVQVYDFDVEDGIYYMVMELLAGDTLKARLSGCRARGDRIPLGEIVRIQLDVLSGLTYAHDEGMVHRDVKPANILLTRRGEAVLADFGIAQIVGVTRYTVSGALMGTLSYMAPEQGLKGEADARSDIYSMGIVLYEMLTQCTPFEADTPLAILMKHLNDPLPIPRQGAMAISAPFERVLLRALAKAPEDRYQQAEEMAAALQQAAESAGVTLPTQISLPLTMTRSEAPPAPSAVISGAARAALQGAWFAGEETQAITEPPGALQGADKLQALREAGKRFLGALGAVTQEVLDKATEEMQKAVNAQQQRGRARRRHDAVREAGAEAGEPAAGEDIQPVPGRSAPPKKQERRRSQVGMAILGAAWIALLANLCMLTSAVRAGDWDIFVRGWPLEVYFVAWGLCIIMYISSSIWMLIPTGLVLGAGTILTYSWWSENWGRWDYLWLEAAWVAVLAVGVPILLGRYKRLSRLLSRLLALLFSLVSIGMIFVIGMRIGLFHPPAGWESLVLP